MLKSMAGLDDAKQLRRLFLYSNAINKIEHLEHMTELQSLWLNNNRITVLEVSLLISCDYVSFFRTRLISKYNNQRIVLAATRV